MDWPRFRPFLERTITDESTTAPAAAADAQAEVGVEQAHVSRLYAQLDVLRTEAKAAFDRTASSATVGTPGARAERDAFMRLYGTRVRTLENVEERLCFGRLDLATGERRYVG